MHRFWIPLALTLSVLSASAQQSPIAFRLDEEVVTELAARGVSLDRFADDLVRAPARAKAACPDCLFQVSQRQMNDGRMGRVILVSLPPAEGEDQSANNDGALNAKIRSTRRNCPAGWTPRADGSCNKP